MHVAGYVMQQMSKLCGSNGMIIAMALTGIAKELSV